MPVPKGTAAEGEMSGDGTWDSDDDRVRLMIDTDKQRLNKDVVVPGIPGLRAVPDLVTIHPILPPTVHLHPCILLASSSLLVEVYPSF